MDNQEEQFGLAVKTLVEDFSEGNNSDALEQANSDGGSDYILKPEHTSCWIDVGEYTVYIVRRGDGVATEIYVKGQEGDEHPIDSVEVSVPAEVYRQLKTLGYDDDLGPDENGMAQRTEEDTENDKFTLRVKGPDFTTGRDEDGVSWKKLYDDEQQVCDICGHDNLNVFWLNLETYQASCISHVTEIRPATPTAIQSKE